MRRRFPPSARLPLVLAAIVSIVCACGDTGEPDRSESPGAAGLRTLTDGDLDTWADLERAIGFGDEESWRSVELDRSVVTGTRRRLWYEKEAVTRALEAYERPRNGAGPPIAYPPGAVFVAESIDGDGAVTERAVIHFDGEARAGYLVYDARGFPAAALTREHGLAAAPASCVGCHESIDSFHPMMSYPAEPRGLELDVPAHLRDMRLTLALLEGRRRGSPVVGIYGTLWLSHLAWADRNGMLLDVDASHLARLRERYADLLGDG